MITALTTQVLPRTTDALLTFWTSRSRKAAPRKKKCQCVRSQLATRLSGQAPPDATEQQQEEQARQEIVEHGDARAREIEVRPIIGRDRGGPTQGQGVVLPPGRDVRRQPGVAGDLLRYARQIALDEQQAAPSVGAPGYAENERGRAEHLAQHPRHPVGDIWLTGLEAQHHHPAVGQQRPSML